MGRNKYGGRERGNNRLQETKIKGREKLGRNDRTSELMEEAEGQQLNLTS